MNHLTWSDETQDGKCPKCGDETVIVIAPDFWRVDEADDTHDTHAEVTGHYCRRCRRLRSLSLNTQED